MKINHLKSDKNKSADYLSIQANNKLNNKTKQKDYEITRTKQKKKRREIRVQWYEQKRMGRETDERNQ